jgi:Kef-type K+ transport system membrane component KefB
VTTYLAVVVLGAVTLVVALRIGGAEDAAPEVAPLSAVDGPAAACLGDRLASVQSGTFLDLHRPGPPGGEDDEAEVGDRVARGRVDRETGRSTLRGRCAPGTELAGQPFEADVVLTAPDSGGAGATAAGALVAGGGRPLDLAMAPTTAPPRGDEDRLAGGELTARIFLAVAVVILAARVVGAAFSRIRQPKVMGEIVAGILLGPSLVGLVAPEVTTYLFPPEVTGVLEAMAQFGLIFFMFLIGMELDLGLVRGSGGAALLVAHASMVVPFSLGVALAVALHPLAGNGEFTGFALFLGAAMAITAFPVLARILTDTGLYRTRLGVLSLTSAAVGDLTAWCVLAAVVAVVKSSGPGDAVRTVVLSVAFVALLLVVVRPAVARLAEVHERRGRLNPPLMAGLLVGLLVASWATEQIGIHAIFGAFMLGVVMPRSRALVGEITEKLEDVTVLFLLPIFFAVVGLSTRFGLLDQPALWATAAAVVVLAVVGKLGGTLVAARAAGEGWRSSVGLGLLMNTRGLTEIVILTVGRSLGVISPALFTIMVIMALVTTFMATPLLALVYPRSVVERDARRAASLRPGGPGGRHRIVVAVGSPDQAEPVVDVVRRMRAPGGARPSVVLASVVQPPGREEVRANLSDVEQAEAEAREALVPLAAELLRAGLDTVVRTRVSPDPGAELARLAEAEGASLVFAGWHRPWLGRNQLGGVVGDVLDEVSCDVAVLLEHDTPDADRDGPVSVWFAGGFHDGAALDLAVRVARDGTGSLRVLHPPATDLPDVDVEVEDVRVASQEPGAVLAGVRGSSLVVLGRDDRGDATGLGARRREAVLTSCEVPVVLVQRGETALV